VSERNGRMRSQEPSSRLLSRPEWTGEDDMGRHWESIEYYGVVRSMGRMKILSISATDETARHDWREFQQLKNMLIGHEWEAVEVYPAESELKDPSNRFYLWCFRKGTVLDRLGAGMGMKPGREVCGPEKAIAPQRAFPDQVEAEPVPEHGPIVPSPAIDVMEGYDRMLWNYERRKDVPR